MLGIVSLQLCAYCALYDEARICIAVNSSVVNVTWACHEYQTKLVCQAGYYSCLARSRPAFCSWAVPAVAPVSDRRA